jgi:hypothetical protein
MNQWVRCSTTARGQASNTFEQRHGKKVNVSENMAFNLNYSARLSWITDRKHLQGRVQHLLEEILANQRATARATGIEEENGALKVLLDDFIEEADAFKSTKVERREVLLDTDSALIERDRQARRLAIARHASVDSIDDKREV